MPPKPTPAEKPGVSDAAVQKATGKTWPEWLAELDAAGAQQMTHKEIVVYLGARYAFGGWWQQTVTVGYERARKQRAKGQMADGYQVGASKTIDAPLAKVYAAWNDETARADWLGRKPLAVTKATPRRSMRLAWGKGKRASRVSVSFHAKDANKSQVALEHSRLADPAEAEKMKALWRGALEKLKEMLEK